MGGFSSEIDLSRPSQSGGLADFEIHSVFDLALMEMP